MLRNYLKMALRNFTKYKVYSFINLGGLTLAVTCCLLLGLYVRHEWSFDRFHTQTDRLYRAWTREVYKGDVFTNTVTPYVLGPTLKETYPEVEAMSRVQTSTLNVKKGEEVLSERVHAVDKDFFRMFDFPLVRSTGGNPIQDLYSVVLTEEVAQKYFGTENPVGKQLYLQLDSTMQAYTVTAVAKNVPTHSSIRFGMVIPLENILRYRSDKVLKSWFMIDPETYVLLRERTESEKLRAKFPALLTTVLGDKYQDQNYIINLQPMPDIHLNTELTGGIEPTSNPAYSYILGGIALFILLIACINFMTLSLGRSVSRAQEVGVRKAVGALRGQLMGQFWSEALLMTVLAVSLGVLLAFVLTPTFSQLANQTLTFRFDATAALFLLGLIVMVGLVAGSYPSLVLSGFRPVEVLKGKISLKSDASLFRRSLVVVQFSLSVFLIAGTIVLNQQLNFLQSTSLGYQSDKTVIIPVGAGGEAGRQRVERYRQALASQKEVQSVAASAFPFAEGSGGSWGTLGFTDTKKVYREFQFNIVDPHFIPTYGIKVVQGRNFDPANTADTYGGLIVNQALVKAFDLKDPLNERLPGRFHDHRIIGVTDDFHYASLHSKVQPLVMVLRLDSLVKYSENMMFTSSSALDLSIRLAPGQVSEQVAMLEQTWKAVVPGEPFRFTFLDDSLQRQYEAEQRLSRIVTVASLLSILIACLGLFGLATLAVARRTKEIGIRKVLGASVYGIMGLLSKDFLKLVLIGILIASPLAWFALDRWLQDFAYRISVQWWVFALAGTLAVGVALLTVSLQSIKAALMNPVKSLRSE
ncbi:ABC transporter permease [Rhabdobacter roseus]|uniref:Putative ABC transport system permease protein n=1 Tax=Rhabdobacter roseus TaxID=1655419 RepID=A0A840TRL8_9BACT|nr:ABC transporter permease [Rhabdobacter roseus]MBB5285565.1 putative ABC transport system permease protein [Rhabdobacter roseus]